MEVKIGIKSVPRELVVETSATFADVEDALKEAVSVGGIFVLSDEKGGKIMVPADKVAYVELGRGEARRIGFGNVI